MYGSAISRISIAVCTRVCTPSASRADCTSGGGHSRADMSAGHGSKCSSRAATQQGDSDTAKQRVIASCRRRCAGELACQRRSTRIGKHLPQICTSEPTKPASTFDSHAPAGRWHSSQLPACPPMTYQPNTSLTLKPPQSTPAGKLRSSQLPACPHSQRWPAPGPPSGQRRGRSCGGTESSQPLGTWQCTPALAALHRACWFLTAKCPGSAAAGSDANKAGTQRRGRLLCLLRHSLAAADHDGNLHALAGRSCHLTGNGLRGATHQKAGAALGQVAGQAHRCMQQVPACFG